MNRQDRFKSTINSLPTDKLLDFLIECKCAVDRGIFSTIEEVLQEAGA